jgi:hypothetical protein
LQFLPSGVPPLHGCCLVLLPLSSSFLLADPMFAFAIIINSMVVRSQIQPSQ